MPTEEKPEVDLTPHDEALIRIAEQFERFNDLLEKAMEAASVIIQANLEKQG